MLRFGNSILLAGLAAVVVPVVLHLLSGARFRTVDWGAMMFLPGGDARRRQASRLRQWILLAMRCGMLGMLSLAMALPVMRIGHGSRPTLAVIILDRSASMGMMENDRTRLDRAKEAGLNVLAGLRAGDQAALVDATDNSSQSATNDLQSVAQKILDENVTDARADFASAIMRAGVICRANPALAGRIFIISDRQANNWDGTNAGFIAQWKKTAGGSITWVPIGNRSAENVGIDSARLSELPAIQGMPTDMEIRVHNFGIRMRGPIHVTISDGKQQLAAADVTLEPRENRLVILPVKFARTGEVRLTIAIDANDLSADNSREYVADVIDPVPVMIISGEQKNGRFRREADFLQLALTPFPEGTTRPAENVANPCVVKVVDSEQWTPETLAGNRVVILANVVSLSSDQVRAVEEFAYSGGGLIIAPGNLVRADQFNQLLYRNATGLSPAALSPPTSADAAPTALLGIDLSHPIFQFLKGSPDPIPQATIARFFPASPHGGDVRVLSSYATGEPFVVEGTYGRGHVLLVTTPLDADWSNLPLSNFYLPFVQSCVKYLCAAGMSKRNLEAGEMIAGNFLGQIDERNVRMELPDGSTEACETSSLGDRTEFRYGRATQAGEYLVRANSPRGEQIKRYVIAPPSDESDLTPLSPDEMRRLHDALGIQTAAPDARSLEMAGQSEMSLWTAGILLVIFLGISELVLASIWGQGRLK